MDMVGHQDIGVERAPTGDQRIAEHRQEQAAVAILEEDRLAIVAALDDVVDLAGHDETGGTRHGGLHCGCREKIAWRRRSRNNSL
jgi:hypothetical protein